MEAKAEFMTQVNDLYKFNQNNIDIKASSAAINDKMLENLMNF